MNGRIPHFKIIQYYSDIMVFLGIIPLKLHSLTQPILCFCVTVAVRVGGGVPGAGAVGCVCSPARGCAGAADSAVGASSPGRSRGRCSPVLHQNTAGGRHR